MWATLSKYINSTDSVDEQALHNIANIIQAYLDHQNNHEQDVVYQAEDTTVDNQTDDNITRVLRNIKKLLGTDDAITKIKETVLVNFKPNYEEQSPDCKQINEDNISLSISLSYKNYLENAKCRDNGSPELFRVKAQLRNQQQNSIRHINDFYDYVDESIIGEAEQFQEDMMPMVINFHSPGRINQLKNTRSFQRVFGGLNGRSSQSVLDDSSKTTVYTEPRNIINEQFEESCIKYANKKFLKTLRTIIERYNNLRDCVHDDTLRTSNEITKTPRDFRYTEPMVRVSDNNIQLISSIRPGQLKQIRINNNFGNNLEAFKRQKPPKTLFVIRGPSYTSKLLSQLRNKFGNFSPPHHHHAYYSSQNNEQQMKYPFDYILNSGYKFDNKQKSLLGNPDANLQITNKILNTQSATWSKGSNNGNNINENGQVNTKPFLDTQGQISRTSEILESNAKGSDLLDTNNVISKDLLQDTEGISFDTINKAPTELQNFSLRDTQVDVNNTIDENGYVELSYLVKYPKSTIYQLQYFVKNTLSYDDFIKVASHVYVNDENKQLVKVQRLLPDNNTQVLFENREFKSPLAIHDIIDKGSKSRDIERMSGNIKTENQEHSVSKLVAKNKTRNVMKCLDDHVNFLKEAKIVAINPVSLQEHKTQTDVKQTHSNVRNEIESDTKNYIDLKINTTGSLQEQEVKPTNIMEIDSIRSEIKVVPLRQDDNVKTYVDQEDSIQKDFINSDTIHGESLRNAQIPSSKYPTDAIEGDKMQIDDSFAKNENKSKDTAAAIEANSHRLYKNGNDLYNSDS